MTQTNPLAVVGKIRGVVGRAVQDELPAAALRLLAIRVYGVISGRVTARCLGWKHGRVPAGSRIIGSRHITVGEDAFILDPVWIEAITNYGDSTFTPTISIGAHFRCSGGMHLTAIDRIEIGDHCLLGRNVFIADHGHGSYGADPSSPSQPPAERELTPGGAVSIGDSCWLGDNVAVLAGVRLGDGCIVGANAVVTKSAPNGSILVGAPARVVKQHSVEAGMWVPTPRSVPAG